MNVVDKPLEIKLGSCSATDDDGLGAGNRNLGEEVGSHKAAVQVKTDGFVHHGSGDGDVIPLILRGNHAGRLVYFFPCAVAMVEADHAGRLHDDFVFGVIVFEDEALPSFCDVRGVYPTCNGEVLGSGQDG